MKVSIVVVATISLMQSAVALEPSVWSGLSVDVQSIPGQMHVNGVPMTAIRFVGRDVHEIERRWLSIKRPLPPRTLSMDAWRVHTVIDQRASEVLQISTREKAPEAIWSSIPLTAPDVAAPRTVRLLPVGCETGRTIEGPRGGEHFLQYSAICRGRSDTLLGEIRKSLQRRGFHVVEIHGQAIEAATKQSRLTLSVMPAVMLSGDSHSTVLVLQRDQGVRP